MNLQAELVRVLHTKYSLNVTEHGPYLMIKTPMVDHLIHVCEGEEEEGPHLSYQPAGIDHVDATIMHSINMFMTFILVEMLIARKLTLLINDPATLLYLEEVQGHFELETGYQYEVRDKGFAENILKYYSVKRTLH